ncbi:metallophosphoesterase family protein [Salinibacillus aidingensis]|uniref:Metallophosphoesterase family protein n=1 Tax=Salinibacillus aidingensis TaxID=237684 RepID=A0ABP3KJY7_9BACI
MLIYLIIFVIIGGISLLLYMYILAHNNHLEKVTIFDKNFPSSSERLNIFFISDVHKRLINQSVLHSLDQIDVTIIGGDLCEKNVPLRYVEENILKLRELNAPIFFVWGNNDIEVNAYKLVSLLSRHKVTILADSSFVWTLSSGDRIQLAGLHSLYLRQVLTSKYFENIWKPDVSYTILANHEPESYDLLNKEQKEQVNLVLSGHTHGGQIRFLGFGLRNKGGWKKVGHQHFLVSEGYGTSTLPLRLGTRAECHCITIQSPS